MTTPYPNNLVGIVKEAIAEWESITNPSKSLADTIVGLLHYNGYSYSPAKEVVADTFIKASLIAQKEADSEKDWLDRDTCEYLSAVFLIRASALRKMGPEL